MSRPELLGLLGDIKQRPDDLSLRLILADWLEDHGDAADRARAELIRLQVRGEGDGRGLIAAHQPAWVGPLEPFAGALLCRGGLLTFVGPAGHVASSALQAHAEAEAWAWVDEVNLRSGGSAGRLATNPLLRSLNAFSYPHAPNGWRVAEDLAGAAWMQTIHRLDLSGSTLTRSALEHLFASPHLRSLRDFNYSSSSVILRDIATLGTARLRRLVLGRCRIGDRVAEAVANEPGFLTLEELNLADNEIADAGAAALAASPYLGRVRLLTLFGNGFGPDGARRLRERFGQRVLMTGA